MWLQSFPYSCGRTIRNPSLMFPKETPIHTLVHRVRLGWDCVFGLSLGPPLGQVDLCSCLFRKSYATASVPGLVSVYQMSSRSAESLKDSFRLLSWFPPPFPKKPSQIGTEIIPAVCSQHSSSGKAEHQGPSSAKMSYLSTQGSCAGGTMRPEEIQGQS